MVVTAGPNSQILRKVAEIYNWLDVKIRRNSNLAGKCDACGRCCDFEAFDHRLFVTPPELMYLAAKLGAENIKSMSGNLCPYNVDGRCAIYEYRFAGCRIFFCKGDKDFQGGLSESVLKKFKSICTEFKIPYRYTELSTALNGFAAH
jgi:hypothetical protein